MIGESIVAIFEKSRHRKADAGPSIIPDSFFDSFGPDTAVVKKDVSGNYHVSTWSDLGRQKKEWQMKRLASKRGWCCEPTIRPVYVWVFHCPGLGGVAYYGWWTYLVWRGGNSGKYLSHDEETIRQLMDLFPMAGGTFYGPPLTHEEWQIRFAKAFSCRNPDGTARKHARRIQGKALLWAEFRGGHLERILGRAYLPKREDCNESRGGIHG